MHEKYGPIVRVNPYEPHIIDHEFYDELYSSNRKSDK
ncbi:Cytochrome P450 monooxygenase sdnE [Colletotrichum siamense]|nr:Cytochrome P450 monooxygenase sdnE [Colletotrichum siamense]